MGAQNYPWLMRAKLSSLSNHLSLWLQDLTQQEVTAPVSGEFVKGINLGGEAVSIQGQRWQSHSSALASGLTLVNPQTLQTHVLPQPYASREMRQMLNSLVYRPQMLELTQMLPNGSYEIYLWLIENYQSGWHALELGLNGLSVAKNLGQLPVGGWARYGGYAVSVTDGLLQLALSTDRPEVDAHLMGLSIFRLYD